MRVPLLLCLICIGLLGMGLMRDNPLNQRAQAYAATVAASAGATYLTLRSLNAFLSTAQEVEVGGSLVVSGTAQPFKVLEPVDDTIERMAGIVFVVMVTTGVIAVALGPISAVGFGMLALAGCVLAVHRWLGSGRTARAVSRQLLAYGLFLGIAAPLALVLTSLLADTMTADVWARHTAIVAEITAQVEPDLSADAPSGLSAVWGDVERYRTLAANLYDRADVLIASLFAILAVFLFKVLVLPIVLLGALFLIARGVARQPPDVG